jgi:hypothetical protein
LSTRRAALPPPLEAEEQATIVEVAQRLGWRVAHFRPAQTARGWRTPVAADGKGFVDLTFARERVLFAELKRPGAKPSAEQVEWLDVLAAAEAEVYLWTLDDLEEIRAVLVARWRCEVGSSWIPGQGRRDDG